MTEEIVWRRTSDWSMAPHKKTDGERLLFSICKIGSCTDSGVTFEAWDLRGQTARQIKTGLKSYQDAQAVIQVAMVAPV